MTSHLSKTFIPCIVDTRDLALFDSIEFPLNHSLSLCTSSSIVGHERNRGCRRCRVRLFRWWGTRRLSHDFVEDLE